MKYTGPIVKMETGFASPVKYRLPVGDDYLSMNDLIGKYICFRYMGEIRCIACGRKTNRSFAQGFCYPCFLNAPETSECVLRPELCQAHEGIARDMDWAKEHCLTDHVVYLAVSSGLKVGVTRIGQVPTRWIDQGAVKAIKIALTPNRHIAGLIETELKKSVSDRTVWQRMLKNQVPENIDLQWEKQQILDILSPALRQYSSIDDDVTTIEYPVREYPQKVRGLNFDKHEEITGRLWGIKGQYLMFDDGTVLNIRRHNGYVVTIEV